MGRLCILLVSMFIGALPLGAQSAEDINRDLISYIDAYKSKDLKKDEFETTDAYKKRVAEFVGKDFVAMLPANSKSAGQKTFSYDADAQVLSIRLLGSGSVEALSVIASDSDEAERLGPSKMLRMMFPTFLLQRVVDPSVDVVGVTVAGVKFPVKQLLSREWSIGFANLQYVGDFKTQVQQVKLDASRAKQLIQDAQWKLYVTSELVAGQRDFIVHDGMYAKATVASPTEVVVVGKTMIATLRRAELVDGKTGEIFATFSSGADYPTNPVAGARVLLGVNCVPMSTSLAELVRLTDKSGCLVGAVTPQSVASKGGVIVGDVIRFVDDKKIDVADDLIAVVKTITPGQEATLTVWRDAKELSVKVSF